MLSDLEIARQQRVSPPTPDLEADLVAMLERLSARRRVAFLRQFASELPRRESAGTALLGAPVGGDR